MESNVNYTLVGAFVLVLTIALIIFITWLSTGFSTKHYKNYLVIMHESVSGLGNNSSVKYNGVNVGTVKKIYLSKDFTNRRTYPNNPRDQRHTNKPGFNRYHLPGFTRQ